MNLKVSNDFHLASKIPESMFTSPESLIHIYEGMFIVLQCFSTGFNHCLFSIDLLTVCPVDL